MASENHVQRASKGRLGLVFVLGVLFCGLILHLLFSHRMYLVLQYEPLEYLWSRIPGGPTALVGALVVIGLGLVSVILIGRRLFGAGAPHRRRELASRVFGGAFLACGLLLLTFQGDRPVPQEWSGAAAVVVGSSLAIVTLFGSKRNVLLAHLVLALAAAAALFPLVTAGHRTEVAELRALLERERRELDAKRDQWENLSVSDVLRDVDLRATQHDFYRFEEQLDEIASLDAEPTAPADGLLFELPRDGHFTSVGASSLEFKLSERKQLFPDYAGGTMLVTDHELALDVSEVGALRLSMTVSEGSYFQIFWGSGDAGRSMERIRVPLATPGKSSVYEIREQIIRKRGLGRIDHVWLIPSDRNARVEIESFQILDRASGMLRGVPFSTGYENVDDEIRRVLLVSTPSELTYEVDVPAERPQLRFGFSGADANNSAKFEVSLTNDDRETTLFQESVAGANQWNDRTLDLAEWAGKHARISFKTTSATRGVAMWSNPVLFGRAQPLPNVVIFVVDTLRADHLGAYGYDRDTSPVFDELSASGVLFEQAYSTGTMTKHAIPALLSSNPVSATGVRHGADVLPSEFVTLPEVLRTMGYATAAFTTNGNAGPYSGTHQGFSYLFNRTRITRGGKGDSISPDAEYVVGDLLENWVQEHKDRNFLLYVHTMDAHGPYDPPEEYRHFMSASGDHTPVEFSDLYDPRWLESPSRETRVDLYDGEIAYGDVHLGRFVEILEDADLFENTLFIFTSDHGEYFGEHGKWGHNPPPFVQGTRIPLLVVGPGVPQNKRIAEPVQLLDLAPTVLDALGLSLDPRLFQGRSLLPLMRGVDSDFARRVLYIEAASPGDVAFITGRYHFIPKKNLLFDLHDDPDETNYINRFFAEFGLKSLGREVARDYVVTYEALNDAIASNAGDTVDVDPATLEQLRSLGYIP